MWQSLVKFPSVTDQEGVQKKSEHNTKVFHAYAWATIKDVDWRKYCVLKADDHLTLYFSIELMKTEDIRLKVACRECTRRNVILSCKT